MFYIPPYQSGIACFCVVCSFLEECKSDWMPEDTQKTALPIALDLSKLYEQMLKALIPETLPIVETQGSMKEQMELIERIKAKERAYDKLKAKRDKEKQFNKKVKLNEELRILKNEIDSLKIG